MAALYVVGSAPYRPAMHEEQADEDVEPAGDQYPAEHLRGRDGGIGGVCPRGAVPGSVALGLEVT